MNTIADADNIKKILFKPDTTNNEPTKIIIISNVADNCNNEIDYVTTAIISEQNLPYCRPPVSTSEICTQSHKRPKGAFPCWLCSSTTLKGTIWQRGPTVPFHIINWVRVKGQRKGNMRGLWMYSAREVFMSSVEV